MRRKYSKSAKQDMCANWRTSGKTRKAFAAANGITYKTLSRWLDEEKAEKLPSFIKLGEVPKAEATLDIIAPNGMRCHVTLGNQQLTTVLERWLTCK